MSIGSPYDRGALQEKFATLILECKGSASERQVAKVCANALANVETWTPSAVIFDGLKAYCNDSFSKIQESTLPISRALSFALARAGYHDSLQRKIDLLLNDKDLYEMDSQELDIYYGSYANQILTIRDHLDDRHRKGVMRANDTSRLLRLRERVDGSLRELVVDLLRQSGAALIAAGLDRQGIDIINQNR